MKEKALKVSIPICVYNHEKYIGFTLDRILEQKCDFSFEILIGEDSSTDNSQKVIEEYANKYPNVIKPFYREKNLGAQKNTIDLFSRCKGEFIALCDGDDYWTDPYKLQKQVDFLEAHPECVACHHWHKYAYPQEDGSYKEEEAPKEGQGYYPQEIATVREVFANKMRVKTRTVMYRNVVKELPEWFSTVAYGDVPLSMIYGKHGKFGFIDEEMAVYRQTGQGVSTQGRSEMNNRAWARHVWINWVEVWEKGSTYYPGRYREEVSDTIQFFYSRLLTPLPHRNLAFVLKDVVNRFKLSDCVSHILFIISYTMRLYFIILKKKFYSYLKESFTFIQRLGY